MAGMVVYFHLVMKRLAAAIIAKIEIIVKLVR